MAIDRDAILICAERRVSGYPFRVVVHCADGTKIGANGRKVRLGGLRVAAQVYDPARIIAEVDAPVELHLGRTPDMEASFDLAHASAHIDLSNGALRELIAEVVDMTFDLGAAQLAVAEFDMSVRRNPDEAADLDFAIRMTDAVPREGLEPADIAVRGRIGGGASLLQGRPELLLRTLATEGLPLVIDTALVECGDMLIDISGTLELRPDGLVDGELLVAVAGTDEGLPYKAVMNPKAEQMLSGLLKNFFASAPTRKIGDREAHTVAITLDESRVKPGGWITVATLPPLPLRFR
ncbi:DUF2125 domain-containing protein [Acuticoccus sp. I52.16.1]|nr:DUF2125 domain-containing protein [Acuticoccus sp. I52.16.1]